MSQTTQLSFNDVSWSIEEAREILYDFDDTAFCVYCGQIADTEDHLRPRAWTGDAARPFVETVPACRECNTILGANTLMNVSDRRRYVHEHLRQKHKSLIAMVPFSNDELAEFGPTLRSQIEGDMKKRRLLMARLAWPKREATIPI